MNPYILYQLLDAMKQDIVGLSGSIGDLGLDTTAVNIVDAINEVNTAADGNSTALTTLGTEVDAIETALGSAYNTSTDLFDNTNLTGTYAGSATDFTNAINLLDAQFDALDGSDISIADTNNYYDTDDANSAFDQIAEDLTSVAASIAGVASDLSTHEGLATDAHDASAISIVDSETYYTSENVEGALGEVGASLAVVENTLDSSTWKFPVTHFINYTAPGAPTGGGVEGEVFLDTSGLQYYIHNGSSWGTGTALAAGDTFIFNDGGVGAQYGAAQTANNTADYKVYSYDGSTLTSALENDGTVVLYEGNILLQYSLFHYVDGAGWSGVQIAGDDVYFDDSTAQLGVSDVQSAIDSLAGITGSIITAGGTLFSEGSGWDDTAFVNASTPYLQGSTDLFDAFDTLANTVSTLSAGAASQLSDLTDVDDTLTPTNAQILIYDGNTDTQWEAVSLSGDVAIDELGETTIQNSVITNAMLAETINDASLTQDYIQTSEVDGSTIEFSGGSLNIVSQSVTFGLLSTDAYSTDLTVSATATELVTASAAKAYADAIAAGLSPRRSVRVATTAALTVTYDNGTSGVGATLTNAGTQAAISIDGVALSVGDRVLVKDQTAALQNGIYEVTTVGDGTTNWVLTRSTDYDESAAGEIDLGSYVFTWDGTDNQAYGWIQYVFDESTDAIGTDPISFTQFSQAQTYSADGNGIEESSGVFSLELDGGSLSKSASGLRVAVDGVDNTHIDWGTGAGQVYAGYMPILDSSAFYTGNDVEAALNEIESLFGSTTSSSFGFTEDNVLADNDAVYAALDKLDQKWGDLANSGTAGEGAALVGLEDANGYTDETDVEGAINEIYSDFLGMGTRYIVYAYNASNQISTETEYLSNGGNNIKTTTYTYDGSNRTSTIEYKFYDGSGTPGNLLKTVTDTYAYTGASIYPDSVTRTVV